MALMGKQRLSGEFLRGFIANDANYKATATL